MRFLTYFGILPALSAIEFFVFWVSCNESMSNQEFITINDPIYKYLVNLCVILCDGLTLTINSAKSSTYASKRMSLLVAYSRLTRAVIPTGNF